MPLERAIVPRAHLAPRIPAPSPASLHACPLLVVLLLAACGQEGSPSPSANVAPVPTAATLGEQAIESVEAYLAAEPYVSADRTNGERSAQVCRACHTLGAGERNLLGPNLHGVFGRRAGSLAGYDYSDVLREAGFTWTPRALDAWLARPAHFLPGNRMAFAGVNDAGDRADLIAYLLGVTSDD